MHYLSTIAQNEALNAFTILECLNYSTIKITTDSGAGSGFIYRVNIAEDFAVDILITNKHVVDYQTSIMTHYFFNLKENGNVNNHSKVSILTEWLFHPDKEVDLCFTFLNPIVHPLNMHLKNINNNSKIFYMPWPDNYPQPHLNYMDMNQDVVMIGYPLGLSDEKNNLPIYRHGKTASHPKIDFNGKLQGVVDMACFPGSSGSPIFAITEAYQKKKTSLQVSDGTGGLTLLGFLYAGPIYDTQGDIQIKQIPMDLKLFANIKVQINLGYYIKASALKDFTTIILDKAKKEIKQHNDKKNGISQAAN